MVVNNNKADALVAQIPQAYRDVAVGMEQQFIQHMIEQMRKTIEPATPPSSALRFYQSVLNNHQANIMAKKNDGIGLQKIILDQIYPQGKRGSSPREIIGNYQYHQRIKP